MENQNLLNNLYSRHKYLELIGISKLVKDDVLKKKVWGIFHKLGLLGQCNIEAFHWKKKTTIVKFNNSKDCLQIVRAKKKKDSKILMVIPLFIKQC